VLSSIEGEASTLQGAGDLERTILALRACGASTRKPFPIAPAPEAPVPPATSAIAPATTRAVAHVHSRAGRDGHAVNPIAAPGLLTGRAGSTCSPVWPVSAASRTSSPRRSRRRRAAFEAR
jgi:hypothetical protein